MGEETKAVKVVASTVSEVEHLVPYLLECQSKGRSVNVGGFLHSMPAVEDG